MDHFTEKEEHILRSAMDVFLEKGRHGARMQEIADRAGVNKALLHYYFRSKDKLYAMIFGHIFKKIFREMDNLINENLPFEQLLKHFIDNYIDILKNEAHIPLFFLRELSEGGNVVREEIKQLVKSGTIKIPFYFRDLILKEKREGRIADVDPIQFIITLIGSCVFFFAAEPVYSAFFFDEETYDRGKFIEERKTAVFNTLYYGLKLRSKADDESGET